ncbi:MAG: CRTAC1 family protein [Planctomycetaceae bacterium]|nr:CRTAC1 family protein [Planctomycetaceae bacterium]
MALVLAASTIASGCKPATSPSIAAGKAPIQPTADARGPPWFRDVTAGCGLDFTYTSGEEANRYTLLESLGGGVGLIDYDRDGWFDLVLPGGGGFDSEGSRIHGRPTGLFRNLGNGKFANVTEATGLDRVSFYSHGCAAADYDRDGWPDFAVTGYGRLALFHNTDDGQGGRKFEEVAQPAGIDGPHDDPLWGASAAWGDIDGNGYADLFVCHYTDWSFANDPICPKAGTPHGRDVCPPQRFQPQRGSLFLSNGDGTFHDATQQQSLRAEGCGLGAVIVDVDGNSQPDIYVANDATPNFLYINLQGRLEERGLAAGVALDEEGDYDGSMGVDAGDPHGTGRPALWVTNFQGEVHALYAQIEPGLFYHDEKAAGIAALGRRYVGFGTGFVDADNDGWEDLVIVNGHVQRFPVEASYRQRAVLLHNVERNGRRFFDNISSQGGAYFERELLGRGLAIGDLNNDGWPDLVISHSNSPVVVLMNERVPGENHWLGVELVGRDRRDVAGATATVELEGRRLTRYAKGGGSYLSSSDRRLLFGLGPTQKIGRLSVHWPWGQIQHWEGLIADNYYRLREGEPQADRQTSAAAPPHD